MNRDCDYDYPEHHEEEELAEVDDNERRRACAAAAVDAYYLRTRHELGPVIDDTDDWAEVISDLLCDLRHLADSRGVDWVSTWSRGRNHYLAEKACPTL